MGKDNEGQRPCRSTIFAAISRHRIWPRTAIQGHSWTQWDVLEQAAAISKTAGCRFDSCPTCP